MGHRSGLRIPAHRPPSKARVFIDRQIVMWLLAASLCALFLTTLPAQAQTTLQPMPENAIAKSYGAGWECNIGFRRDGDACAAIIVPKNAYATNRAYGLGWDCFHGFRRTGETGCADVVVPEGGFLDPSSERWHCLRGFAKLDDACQKIVLPANAYLEHSSHVSTWVCERGFKAKDNSCVAIEVPVNAYLNTSSYGLPWTCERGFREKDGQCEAVVSPANAYFEDVSHGNQWKCERGYAAVGQTCELIDVPQNAHLDRSGNRWECNRNFQKSKGLCVLNN